MTTIIHPTSADVAHMADFDHPFAVIHRQNEDGTAAVILTDGLHRPDESALLVTMHAPEAYDPDGNATTLGEWSLPLSGFTGQHGYSGPWLHDSEVIDGGVGDYVLRHPGFWVAVYATYSCDVLAHWMGCDCETLIEGWTMCHIPFPTSNTNAETRAA